jgi:deoxyribonuclease V
MKLPRMPHSWDLSPGEAMALQRRLAARVLIGTPRSPIRFVAGLDAAFSTDGRNCIAGVVLWDRCERRVVGQCVARRRLTFPYVPGLLSFREAPALLAALAKLARTPDLLMCDGQGLAHPRRFGIACHLGVITGLPAIGCAKSRLIGEHANPGRTRGDVVPLMDDGEIIGEVLRTRDGVKPIYVSIGHRMDLPAARNAVLDCTMKYRLPEPTRRADRLVAAARRGSLQPPVDFPHAVEVHP